MINNQRCKNILDSQRGVTLMEVMVTLVILCLFTVVFTQMIGISFKDIFFRGSKMDATAVAQDVMERIKAAAYNDPNFDDAIQNLDGCLIVDSEEDLLVYNKDYDAQVYIEKPASEDITVGGTPSTPVLGILAHVVVFYNNGGSYYYIRDFI